MAPVLLAVGSCSEALEMAPLLAALRSAGVAGEVAWFGSEEACRDATSLGLDLGSERRTSPANAAGSAVAAAAAAYAAELLRRPWRLAVTLGHGMFAQALGTAALRDGIATLRLGAGVRTHTASDPTEVHRRLADHAASHWCVASEWQRQDLLREGVEPGRVHLVGSLLEAAMAGWPAPGVAAAGPIWLAWERPESVADPERLRERLRELAAAAGQLRVHAVATLLAPALARHDLSLPPGITLATGATAREQLAHCLTARLIVTDSVGYQLLAMARGIACVAHQESGVLAEGIASGTLRAIGNVPGALGEAITRALQGPPPERTPGGDVAARILAVIQQATSAAAVPAAPPAVRLPSDGDASGRTLGEDEVALAAAAIRRGTLNSTRGTFVTTFEQRFAQWLGRKHAIACASGSAAMHCAIAALQLAPGDEVVTTPITDMGALTPILYEGGVPVFADVDPVTLNVTAETIAAQLTPRTRAIVVTHLFGMPCDLAGIGRLAQDRGLPLIEDAAQAFGATWGRRKVGTFGSLAAFSLQQGKHITTGEGGIVATDDDALARRVFLYVNKAWGYGDKKPDHYFPALNYRLTELQGAVATAQLPKLDGVVAARRAVAASLREALADTPGLHLPHDPQGGTHSFWKFAFQVDPERVPGGAVALGQRMQQAGIACVPRYIQKPAFECELFVDWRRSPVTWMPLQHNPRRDAPMPLFHRRDYPGAVRGLDHVVVLPINERYTAAHVEHVASAIRAAVGVLQHA